MSSMITKIAVTQMPETRPAALHTARRRSLPTSPWPVGRQLCPQAGSVPIVSAPTVSAPIVFARNEKYDPGTSVWRPPV
jgi:hypothetical protein